MIKNWGKFNEGVDEYTNNIFKILKDISNTGNFRDLNEITDDKFINDIINRLFIYTEYRYDELSKEIRKFLTEFLLGHRWTDGPSSLRRAISPLSFSKKYEFIEKSLIFYEKIKGELDHQGYPVKTKLLEELEHICNLSLDDEILEFYDCYEEFNGVSLSLITEKKLSIDTLSKITEELLQVKGRIKDSTKLEETGLEFTQDDEALQITIRFN